MTPEEQLALFVKFLARDQHLLMRLLRGERGNPENPEKSEDYIFDFEGRDMADFYAKLKKKNDKGWGVFAQVGYVQEGSKEPQGNYVLWADMDYDKYPGGQAQVDQLLNSLALKPTMVVKSGHGQHLYWALESAIHPEDARRFSKALQWSLGSDAVHNPNRIMRVPGLNNNKPNRDPVPVVISDYQPDRIYTPAVVDDTVDHVLARLPHKLALRLVLGPTEMTDRSAYDFGLATAFMEQGLDDSQVRYLLNTYHGSGKKDEMLVNERLRYIDMTIGNARKKIGVVSLDGNNPLANPQFKLYTIEEMETLFQPNYVIQDLLPETGIMIVAAEPKARKSFFAMQMALSVATGTKFLEFDTQRPRSVLYVQAELAPYMVGERFRTMLGSKPRPMNVRIANIKAADLTNNPDWLIELVQREKFEVVIIDPVAKFITGDENNSISVGQFFSNMGRVQSLGASVILVHHSRKIERGSPMTADKMRGSNRWFADVDSAVLLSRQEEETIIHYEMRAAAPRADQVLYVWPDASFRTRPFLTPEQKALYAQAAKQHEQTEAEKRQATQDDIRPEGDSPQAGVHA